ncbi:MAG: sulfatase-like hydrolase/transferase [Acidobacteria bacterium]|nr:sulfatase-like hydrolase/transferase [Acidobacteriota bacterium]MBU4329690.1 sulfatase-like hydrolase/transferase [Acidobacteriota bacterium]
MLFKPAPSGQDENIPVTKESDFNVLLITLDTTRADRLGCYGYSKAKTPYLDFLARNGVRFADAYCQVPLTLPSHSSILTGTYPTYHNVHNNGTYSLAPDQITLAEVLHSNNFQTAAFLASFSVDSRFGLDQGFDLYDDNFQEGSPFKAVNSERKAEVVYSRFSGWLDDHSTQQFFGWIHFFDPHLPYSPPDSYGKEFADRPYDGEIAYMDSYVGAVIKKLREKNILGKTLIIVAGDHGEGLGDKVETGHGIFLYENVMRVPLIFYAENLLPEGKVIPTRVRLIDIMPTVLDFLKIEGFYHYQGISLVPVIEGKKTEDLDTYIETYYPRENYGWAELTGLISGDWKYIHAPKRELYDLKSDPSEKNNLFLSDKKTASVLRERLDNLVRSSSLSAGTGKRTLNEEELTRLRSLGYVGFSEGRNEGPFADPKDKVDELRMIQEAQSAEFLGNFQEAARLHEKMLELRPKSSSSYINLALIQARLNNLDQTIRTLKQGIDKIPDSQLLLARLGHTYMVTGRLNEAFSAMQKVLALNPEHVDALTVSAVVSDSLGNKGEGRLFYERALAIEPENKYLRMSYALNLATGGDIPEAVRVYSRLIQDYPKEYILYQYLGIAYGVLGDYSNAIKYLEQGISIQPTAAAYFNLAVAFKETGKTAEAIRALELYLENPKGEDEESIRSVRMELQNLKKSPPPSRGAGLCV